MPRDPNKIKTSLFKAVQKQALLWSDGDLIMWGHQECTACTDLIPVTLHSPGRTEPSGSPPHTALPLLFALPSSIFYEIPFVRGLSSHACVCMQRCRVCLQHCKHPQYTRIAVSCTTHSEQLPVCPDSVFHIRAASGSHYQPQKEKRDMVKIFSFWKLWSFSAV